MTEEPASRSGVRRVYDRIAPHFAKTRQHPWPEVESFVESAPRCGRALDVGCGNGRHAELLSAYADAVVGVDLSRGMLGTARERTDGTALLAAGAAALPLVADSVDLALYVATLHHLPDGARHRSLDELARVLRPGGQALVSAWSTEHDRFDPPVGDRVDGSAGFDTTVDWTLPDGEAVPRYYHIYAPEEFEADLRASALAVADVSVSSGNCYAEVRPEGKRSFADPPENGV